MTILMVCLGNICRSPMAEAILQKMAWDAGLKWSVESAGTNGYHVGEAPHRLSQKVCLQHGLDISHQRAAKFTSTDIQRFDKIYAMASDVIIDMKSIAKNKFDAGKVSLIMDELYPGQHRDVPDPWYGPEPGYHEVFNMLERACTKIIENARASVQP